MSQLTLYSAEQPEQTATLTDFHTIAGRLNEIGVLLDRWQADTEFSENASNDAVLTAYKKSIEQLKETYRFESVDVINITPAHPDKQSIRQKFLQEHTHDDFEIRFFVAGSGLFYLHVDDKVYAVMCGRGDLISVPAHTPHWFDMGEHPDLKCIRFFTTQDGWVARLTGNDIATKFPTYDQYLEDCA